MLAGATDESGYGEAVHRGLLRARDELRVEVDYRGGVPAEPEAIMQALRELARGDAPLIIVAGAGTSEAAQRVAWEFPDTRFAVIDGSLLRPNLAVYEVEQAESAWLGGAAAALLTKTGTVAHVGGDRDPTALKARAAFAAGAQAANPKVRVLTGFAGSEPTVAQRLASRAIDDGADIIFSTATGPAASAVIDAGRARGVRMIGAGDDWVARNADVFVASAVADPGVAVFAAARDLRDNVFVGDIVRRFGLRRPDAVRLSLRAGVPAAVRERLDEYRAQVASGGIKIPPGYTGPELGA